jgi:hypothetical protein
MWAVQKGNVSMITAMVDRGADVNLTDLVSWAHGCLCVWRSSRFITR